MRKRQHDLGIAPRQLCRDGAWFIIRRYAPPILLALAAADLLLWAWFHFILHRCYGIGCLMG
ncbi:hypothetical protein GC177_09950 [bacterium]|nr:hypothetical protein [bacterium]